MIARIVCLVRGHKRGKPAPEVPCLLDEKAFRCPRCKSTWTRKAKVVAS